MNMPKITVDKKKCIGCGNCASVCKNFVLENGKARAVKPNVTKITCEKEAADECPVGAIKITG